MRTLLSLLLLSSVLMGGATTFDSGGFTYEVISESTLTCRLISAGNSGTTYIAVPGNVIYGSHSYAVTEIGENAFSSCSETLTALLLDTYNPAPVNFAHDALRGVNLQTLYLRRDFTSAVNDEPFEGMTSLTSLNIYEGVTRIPNFAFHGCSFTSLTLPSSVKSIGVAAFDNSKLEKLTFSYGSKLESIGLQAFNGSKLNAISLPVALKYIGDEAFAQTAIKSLFIPPAVERIGSNAFAGCTSLTSLTISPLNPNFAIENNLLYSADFHTLLQAAPGVLNISVNSATQEIAPYAFNGSRAETISLPSGLKKIGEYSFIRCYGITTLELPDGLEEIGRGAFAYCRDLDEITLPPLQNIPEELFMGSAVKRVKCTGYPTIVGVRAFCACSKLVSIELPFSVNKIEESAFERCTSLSDPELPYNLVYIGDNAFSDCTAIETVLFYRNVERIGAKAFANVNLTEVSCDGVTPPVIDLTTFSNKTYTQGKLLIPTGSTAAYKEAAGWKFFSTVIESDDLGGAETVIDDVNDSVTIYNTMGVLIYRGSRGLIPTLPAGFYIVNGVKTKF